MEFWHFVRDASPFSQGILALLLLLSVSSWGLILERGLSFRRLGNAGPFIGNAAVSHTLLGGDRAGIVIG